MPVPPLATDDDVIVAGVALVQIVCAAVTPPAVNTGMTVIVDVAVFTHPVALSVPVTVYIVVVTGVATTDVPVDADKVPVGDHVYVSPPPPVNVEVIPNVIAVALGVSVTVGKGLISTEAEPDVVQPVVEFNTVNVLVKVPEPAKALIPTTSVPEVAIRLSDVRLAFTSGKTPDAAPPQTILYLFGLNVVPYVTENEASPKQAVGELGLIPIIGLGFTVTILLYAVLPALSTFRL